MTVSLVVISNSERLYFRHQEWFCCRPVFCIPYLVVDGVDSDGSAHACNRREFGGSAPVRSESESIARVIFCNYGWRCRVGRNHHDIKIFFLLPEQCNGSAPAILRSMLFGNNLISSQYFSSNRHVGGGRILGNATEWFNYDWSFIMDRPNCAGQYFGWCSVVI